MYHVRPIESLDLPELDPYRTMRLRPDHQARHVFVAEGDKLVRRLLRSDIGVVSCLLPEERIEEFDPLLRARPEDITVFVGQKELVETLVGFSLYQGVLAVGRVPASSTLEAVYAGSPAPRLFTAVDGLNNAENLGVVVRNSAAMGVQAILVGETSSSPWLRRSVRNSMGTIFKLPVVDAVNLAETLRELRRRGVRCYAAHPHTEERLPEQVDMAVDCCLVFGSEGHGLSAPVLAACDAVVAIPMQAGVDSLNVGSASAIFLYEADRQRRSRR